MFTKETGIEQITVTANGTILYSVATRVFEDGVLLSKSLHRTSLEPTASLEGQPEQVVAIANVVWTPEVIQAYQDHIAAGQIA